MSGLSIAGGGNEAYVLAHCFEVRVLYFASVYFNSTNSTSKNIILCVQIIIWFA